MTAREDRLAVHDPGGRAETKVVLITGAAGAEGIGFATCRGFRDAGYAVAVVDLSQDTAEAAAAILDPSGQMAAGFAGDVTSSKSVARAIGGVLDRFRRLDALVNNAGLILRSAPAATTDEEWERVLAVDLHGAFRCARAAYPALCERGGSIVNVSSDVVYRTPSDTLAYTVAKAGLEGLTRVLAVAWASDGIRVNSVAPGPVMTGMVKQELQSPAVDQARVHGWIDSVPLRRFATPDEVGPAIVFLCSEGATYITGTTLIVDGGGTIKGRN